MTKFIAAVTAVLTLVSAAAVFALPGNDVRSAAGQRMVPALLPTGEVADTAGRTAYVLSAKGGYGGVDPRTSQSIWHSYGIDAVELASGKLLWHTDGDLTPLLVVGQKLFAQAEANPAANELRVVALDTKNGRQVFLSQPLVFPEGVRTMDGLENTFHSEVSVESNALFLVWNAAYNKVGGAFRGEEGRHKKWSGMVRVDLTTGEASMLPAPSESPPGVFSHVITVPQRTFTHQEGTPVTLTPGSLEYPLTLQCADVVTGKVLWQRPMRPQHDESLRPPSMPP